MASEWREVRLGEVAEIIMGQSPPGKTYNQSGEGLPFFQGIADFGYRHPTPRVYCTAPSRIAYPGDILLSVRAPIGRVNIADKECAIGRGLSIVRLRNSADARYIEFALRYLEPYWHAIEGGGSVFGNATRADLERLLIPWPESSRDRRAIAHILGTLDDKIELNRQMNQTLEEMARALFKSWFVDFEPVRAKAAVRREHSKWSNAQVSRAACPKLKPEIAELFPDEFENSELGEIPKGWRVSRLGDIADVNWGDTNVTKSSYVNEGYLAYSAKGPDGFLSYYDYDCVGVVVSAIGANSGFTWLARGKWSCIKNTIRFWSIVSDVSTEYLYFATHGNNIWPLRGSAQPFISQTDAQNLRVFHPSNGLARKFGDTVSPLFDRIDFAIHESRTLAALRDTLLPKLISGEIRVKDAERFLKERGI
jgi:type I restriction enzyme S subunit